MDNRLFYFGKLPAFGDFVRYNATGKEALDFDQWLQEGIYAARIQLGNTYDTAFERAPISHFYFNLDPLYFLIGVWKPSMDKVGRKFPFVIAARLLKQQMIMSNYLIPLCFELFFQEATGILSFASAAHELAELNHSIDKLDLSFIDSNRSLAEKYDEYITNTTVNSFWHQIFGANADAPKSLLMANLVDILLPLRGKDLTRMSLGLKFPISADREIMQLNASFWLDVSSRLTGNSINYSHFFLSIPGEIDKANFQLFFRLPSAKSFVTLIKPDFDNDFICDLENEGSERIENPKELFLPQYRALFEKPDVTLKEMLQLI